jgi:hypothetical protein
LDSFIPKLAFISYSFSFIVMKSLAHEHSALYPLVDGNQVDDLPPNVRRRHDFPPRVQKNLLKIKKCGLYAIEHKRHLAAQERWYLAHL